MPSEMNRRDLMLAAALGFAGAFGATGDARAGLPKYVYDPKDGGDPYVVRTGITAFQLKLVGIGGISRAAAMGGVMAPEAAASLRLNGLPSNQGDTLWGQFFRGAQILLGHLESDTPVVGYYNPILDYWWLTLWDARGKTRRIVAAKILPGGALAAVRPAATDPKPDWMRRLGLRTVIEELRVSGVAPGQQFSRAFPMDSAAPPKLFDRLVSTAADRDLFVSRGLSATGGVSAFADDGPALAGYADLTGALNMPNAPAPATLAATATRGYAEVASAPLPTREKMRPLAAFSSGDAWYVISAGPGSGRFILLSMIARRARSAVQLALIDTQAGA